MGARAPRRHGHPRRGDAAHLAARADADRITIYRARMLAQAETRAELRRLDARELLRLVVERLELEGTQAVELAATCL